MHDFARFGVRPRAHRRGIGVVARVVVMTIGFGRVSQSGSAHRKSYKEGGNTLAGSHGFASKGLRGE
ncbi:MAG: hypothetical protein K2Q20_11045, partial [Phycisphaerales bacterium]|nr:hypothetical protein [Phycisphaerales bacterium]